MAHGSILNSNSEIIREDLSIMERALEPKVDGIFSRVYTTSEGVVRGGGRAGAAASHGYEVLHTFATGVAGGFRNLPSSGDLTLGGTSNQTGTTYMYNPSEAFPTVGQTTAIGYVQRMLILIQGLGNFALPIHLLQNEQLDATIARPVSMTIKGVAKKVAQSEAICMYQATEGRHATVHVLNTSVVSAIATGPHSGKGVTITFTGDPAQITGRMAFIHPGMLMQWRTLAGATHAVGADRLFIVAEVDYIGRNFTIIDTTGTAFTNTDVTVGDYLIQQQSFGTANANYGPTGLFGWTKNSGSIFGIPVTGATGQANNYPQFKSLVVDNGGNPLTELIWNRLVGGFYDAYGDLCDLDTIIATAGVTTQYINTLSTGNLRYQRQGERLKMNQGWASIDYDYNGVAFDWLVSRYMLHRSAVAIKTGEQNIKRYTPPRIDGAGSQDGFSMEIQWYGPLAGSNTIFMPAYVSDAVVQYLQSPFFCFRESAPDQVQGIWIQNCQEELPT